MAQNYQYFSVPLMEVPCNNFEQIRKSAEDITSYDYGVSESGAHELSLEADEVDQLDPAEAKLIRDVQDSIEDTLWKGSLERVWISWVEDAGLFADYLKSIRNTPFGNFHCDHLRVVWNGKLALAAQPVGRLIMTVNGNGTRGREGLLRVDEADANLFESRYSFEPPTTTTRRISRMGGIVHGLDGHFIRGYPDGRDIVTDLPPRVMTPGQWNYMHPSYVHAVTDRLTNGRVVIATDLKAPSPLQFKQT